MSPLLRRCLPTLILIVAVLAIYGQVLDHQFTAWDDHGYVDHNPYVLRGLEWTTLHWAFTSGSHSNYHPLTWMSHMLDIELYGPWAGGHAFTNLLLHAANSILLWQLVRKLAGRDGVALVVALLFAVHPLNVEAVANISQRKSVLATCFGLLTLLAYIAYTQRGSLWRYALALVLATLSLLAKSLFVTLPCLFLLLDYWPLSRTPWRGFESSGTGTPTRGQTGWARLLAEKAPFFALSLAIGLLTIHFQKNTGAMDTADVDRLTSFAGAISSYVFYLGKTVWPVGLAAFYPLPDSFPAHVLPTSLGLLLAITALCVALHRRHPHMLIGWLWFSGMLVPMAGFVRVGGMVAADRYCYVPLIGLFLAICLAIDKALAFPQRSACHPQEAATPEHCRSRLAGDRQSARERPLRILRPLTLSLGAIVACGLGAVAHRQVAFWKDTETSFTRILTTQGPHDLFPALIGYDLFDRGEFARSIPYFRQSLAVMPSNDWVAGNLGIALYCTGNSSEAEHWLRRALIRNRRNPGALNILAKITEAKGDRIAAINLYREVLEITPIFLEARLRSVRLLHAEGRSTEAVSMVEDGLRLYPDNPALLELAHAIAPAAAPPAATAPTVP